MNSSIDETIDRVEKLYATITGRQPPRVDEARSVLPPEIDPLRHVEDQLAKLMAELEHGLAAEPAAQAPAWMPHATAWHDDTGYELLIDVPGVPRDQLELRVDDRVLVVRGRRVAPWGERGQPAAPPACEAPFGPFARAFALPERVEPSQITARLDAGTLRVRIARTARAEPPQVPISCS